MGGSARNELALVSSRPRRLISRPRVQTPRRRNCGCADSQRPHLPDGWLDSRELSDAQRAKISQAEVGISGG